jgi:hypothetical protein
LFSMDCSDLPDVFWLDHDDPRQRLEQRLTAMSITGGGWITVARCNDCGQVWRVDKSGNRSVDLAVKVADVNAWRDEDDRAARLTYLKRSYGGDDTTKCTWAGCQNRALKSLAMCAEHAFDRMGERAWSPRSPIPPPSPIVDAWLAAWRLTGAIVRRLMTRFPSRPGPRHPR